MNDYNVTTFAASAILDGAIVRDPEDDALVAAAIRRDAPAHEVDTFLGMLGLAS